MTGGFISLLGNKIISNTFILDELRVTLVNKAYMNEARADHEMIFIKDLIYVFGGMGPLELKKGLKSLNSCEVYNIKKDKW